MNSSRLSLYLQSIRGPVLLMTLGVLCALHQADIVSFRFTWPVLIIVVGVLVLGERLTAPPVVVGPFQATVAGPTVPPTGFARPGFPPPAGYPAAPGGVWVNPPNQPPVYGPPRPPAEGQNRPQPEAPTWAPATPEQGERR